MVRKQEDEDVRETVRLLSVDDKIKVLEDINRGNFSQITGEIEDRGYTFVRQTFLAFEELGLAGKDEEDGEIFRTSQGDKVLEASKNFDQNYVDTVERFFEQEHSIQDSDLIHDFIQFEDGEFTITVPGLPEEFMRMKDMFDLFYQLDPQQRLDDLAERYDITEPSVRKRLKSLERHGLVNQRKPNSHEKQYFYGPFAFPLLKLADEIDEVYSPGADWEWILDEEPDREPDFIDYRNTPDESGKQVSWRGSADEDQGIYADPEAETVFEAYDGVPESYVLDNLEPVDNLEELNNRLTDDNRGVRKVVTVNQDNIVLDGGYIWESYQNQEITEGEYLLVEYGEEDSIGFDNVEALGKVAEEALD